MYPLHKYLPTPFGTYLLYIDNGPTRIHVNKDLPQLPTYQAVKEYGRQRYHHHQPGSKYQAFSKPVESSNRALPKPVTAPLMKQETSQSQRKLNTFTPSSTMPNSIWSPKVKRMHLSYNMRQLWHTGQPMKDPPSKVIEVDSVTGAELKQDAQWYKGRSSKEHEGMNITPSTLPHSVEQDRRRQSHGSDKVAIPSVPSGKESRRPKAPPNTTRNSPILSEVYKRQASQLGNNMVPKRQKRSHSRKSHISNDRRLVSQVNRETQTTPYRFAKSSMEYSDASISPTSRARSNLRSTSVPIGSANTSSTKECMEMTGLPPILETDAPVAVREPKPTPRVPVTVDSDGWGQRVRRVQECHGASPTFPNPSKRDYWDEMNKRRYTGLPASHNLLPFTWKEPKRFGNDEKQAQQRKSEMDKLLPVITKMPAVPRV